MNAITDGGLRYAVAKHSKTINNYDNYRTKVPPEMKNHVIIVGAGMAGLAAAYELAQIGHKVYASIFNNKQFSYFFFAVFHMYSFSTKFYKYILRYIHYTFTIHSER